MPHVYGGIVVAIMFGWIGFALRGIWNERHPKAEPLADVLQFPKSNLANVYRLPHNPEAS